MPVVVINTDIAAQTRIRRSDAGRILGALYAHAYLSHPSPAGRAHYYAAISHFLCSRNQKENTGENYKDE